MVMALDKMPALSDYGAIIAQFLPFVVLIVVFYFFLIRPQRKRDKQERDMRNSIEIGDEISTIGGFIGRVVSIKDRNFLIHKKVSLFMRPFPQKMAVSYSYKQNKPLLRRKFSMRKNLTEVVFILDRSGSMSGLEKDTIGGFNSMIEKQKREAGQALISTVLFNNNSKVLYDRVEVQKIPSMTEDDYSVYGCTALLDAIGGAIHHIGNVHKYARTEDIPENTIFIIMTDGMENASHIYRIDKVKQMIERQKEKYGWEFLFLGAKIDAIETANHFGINADKAANYQCDCEGTALNYEVLNDAISAVRCNAALDSSWKKRIDKDYQKRGQHSRVD